MAKPRNLPLSERLSKNRRRTRPSFAEVIRDANRRAHDQTNRRLNRRDEKSVQAAIAATAPTFADDDEQEIPLPTRALRWLGALLLAPLVIVTFWTFLSQFSSAALDRRIWQTSAFWYFAIGMLVMTGWFVSGLLKSVFLYLYVLGHELTHAIFVYLCRGRVTEFHVSLEGGYITTNKTNLIIALSPYFVPFWSVVVVTLYELLFYTCGLPAHADKFLFLFTGASWTFHLAWTLWMIPRDQPDLRENGRFFSLMIISLANLLVLAALLCLASANPLTSATGFFNEWVRHAAVWLEALWRFFEPMIAPYFKWS
jgi:hypothetical protein